MYRLFVYGTLKSGEPFNHLLGSKPVLIIKSLPIYELIDLGDYPGLVENGKTSIIGEVYCVSDEIVRVLDKYEGDEYIRKEIKLVDGSIAQTYVYIVPNKNPVYPKIRSGEWKSSSK